MVQRIDSWEEQDDLLLAKLVLKHIREGNTQKNAFDEAAQKLKRTSAACSYRWNNELKDRYESAVELAKKARLQAIKEEREIHTSREEEDNTLLEQVQRIFIEHAQLKEENERLKQHIKTMETARTQMENDYKTILEIMERTRRLQLPSFRDALSNAQ